MRSIIAWQARNHRMLRRTALCCLVLCLTAVTTYAQAPVKIVCMGDSVTKGERPGVKADEIFSALLEKKLQKAGWKAEAASVGVGGQTSAQGAARLGDVVLPARPTHVVIMYGINDSWIDKDKSASRVSVADYTSHLKKTIARLRQDKIAPLLMTPNPVLAPKYPAERNVTLKKYVEAVRTLAREEKVPLVDVYARFGELALEGTDLSTLFTDSMHPNPKGHAVLADLLFEEFQEQLKKK